jgi:hypothetical protein
MRGCRLFVAGWILLAMWGPPLFSLNSSLENTSFLAKLIPFPSLSIIHPHSLSPEYFAFVPKMYPNRRMRMTVFPLLFIFSFLLAFGHAQRQRIDGAASNGRSTQQQQFPQRFIPNPQKLAQSSQSSTAIQAQQQQIPQQQQQYYSYNSNYNNGANGNG